MCVCVCVCVRGVCVAGGAVIVCVYGYTSYNSSTKYRDPNFKNLMIF